MKDIETILELALTMTFNSKLQIQLLAKKTVIDLEHTGTLCDNRYYSAYEYVDTCSKLDSFIFKEHKNQSDILVLILF